MLKKYLTLLSTVLIFNLFFNAPVFANPKEDKFAEKVKANIAKLGTGKDAKIQVKLKDGTKLRGYISQINENSFLLVDEKTNISAEILYPNAKQVKGHNLSTGAKIAIGVGIVAGILIAFYIIGANSD